MIDYRFTGHTSDGVYVDVRFRTDAINITDTNFNILQIQDGQTFDPSDAQSLNYRNYFFGTFQLKNSTYTDMYNFAVSKGLNLRAYTSDGVEHNIILDDSKSTSV